MDIMCSGKVGKVHNKITALVQRTDKAERRGENLKEIKVNRRGIAGGHWVLDLDLCLLVY